EVLEGFAVTNTHGGRAIEAIEATKIENNGAQGSAVRFSCDLLAVSGGWSPSLDMYCQSGGKAQYDASKACFLPGHPIQNQYSAGSCTGSYKLAECIAQGRATGAEAAQQAGFGRGVPSTPLVETSEFEERNIRPLWVVPSRFALGKGPKQFVDFQNDTSVSDIVLAAKESFHSIEHIKRYTLLGFGTDQGKLSNVNGIAVLAQVLKKDIGSIGTTRFRPAYTPVTFGALAGRDVGALADPIRKTAIHEWHERAGAVFENVGQWKRPWYFPQPG